MQHDFRMEDGVIHVYASKNGEQVLNMKEYWVFIPAN